MAVLDEQEGPEQPVDIRRRRSAWGRLQLVLIGVGILLVAALAGVWLARKPIADNILAREMAKRGVQATYTLDRIGLRTQQISNLTIGDPKDPDLTARIAQVKMRILWNGRVEVYRIAARGVRLKGRIVGKKVSWGQIDKLLPPPSGKPFTLPDISVDLADTTIRLDTPFGPLGFAVAGSGNLSGGFRGRLAASAPRLRPGQCEVEKLRANVALRVDARRPHIVGPLAVESFACPRSRLELNQPRMEIDSRFSEAFGSFDGKDG